MGQVDVLNMDREVVGSIELDPVVFSDETRAHLYHAVVRYQMAKRRSGTHATKGRAMVSGGGRKPYRQKGTGRARQGSIRAPHWRGGGVALGPKPRSYAQNTPKKMVRLALRSALSDRHAEQRVLVVESWGWDTPSTKSAKAALEALGVTGKVLVVLNRDDEAVWKSFRNLVNVHVLDVGELNTYDVLANDWVVFTTATLPGSGGQQ